MHLDTLPLLLLVQCPVQFAQSASIRRLSLLRAALLVQQTHIHLRKVLLFLVLPVHMLQFLQQELHFASGVHSLEVIKAQLLSSIKHLGHVPCVLWVRISMVLLLIQLILAFPLLQDLTCRLLGVDLQSHATEQPQQKEVFLVPHVYPTQIIFLSLPTNPRWYRVQLIHIRLPGKLLVCLATMASLAQLLVLDAHIHALGERMVLMISSRKVALSVLREHILQMKAQLLAQLVLTQQVHH